MYELQNLKTNFTHLKWELKHQHQLWVTLNYPEKMNAISLEMVSSLVEILDFADFCPQIKVIVLTGEGSAFSAGGDVSEMHKKTGMFAGDSQELRLRYTKGIQKIPKCMEDLSKPVIALVNGAAIGAGCDLAMMCDLRVSTEKSRYGETFAKIGLVAGDGGSFFLTRAIGFAKAMQMSLTAEIIEGEKAFQFGLSQYYSESINSIEFVEKLALKISQQSNVALQMMKKSLKIAYQKDIQTQLDLSAAYQGIAQRTDEHLLAVENFMNQTKK